MKVARKNVQARTKRSLRSFRPGVAWVRPAVAALTVVGSAVGITLMLDWMKDPDRWPVRHVQVDGNFRHLQAGVLQQQIEPVAAGGFFVLNVSEIQQRLQSMPWVDQVSVRRVWPDRLDVEVREQQPVAYWGDSAFVNARAQVFAPEVVTGSQNLPRLDGPEGHTARVLAMYHRLRALVAPLQLEVASLQLDARRAWRMHLSNGLVLEIGRGETVQRVARFVRVYPAILASGNGRLISADLRYGHGFAAHWQEHDNKVGGAG